MFDQRCSKRLPFRKKVTFGLSDTKTIGYTADLSESGISIRSNSLFPPKSTILAKIFLDDSTETLIGKVVWTSDATRGAIPSMGIKFSSRANNLHHIYYQRLNFYPLH